MGKKRILDVYRAPFPLYSVKVDPKTGLVVTAGGGGASKTGIKNALVSTEEVLKNFRVRANKVGVLGAKCSLTLAQALLGQAPAPLTGHVPQLRVNIHVRRSKSSELIEQW